MFWCRPKIEKPELQELLDELFALHQKKKHLRDAFHREEIIKEKLCKFYPKTNVFYKDHIFFIRTYRNVELKKIDLSIVTGVNLE